MQTITRQHIHDRCVLAITNANKVLTNWNRWNKPLELVEVKSMIKSWLCKGLRETLDRRGGRDLDFNATVNFEKHYISSIEILGGNYGYFNIVSDVLKNIDYYSLRDTSTVTTRLNTTTQGTVDPVTFAPKSIVERYGKYLTGASPEKRVTSLGRLAELEEMQAEDREARLAKWRDKGLINDEKVAIEFPVSRPVHAQTIESSPLPPPIGHLMYLDYKYGDDEPKEEQIINFNLLNTFKF